MNVLGSDNFVSMIEADLLTVVIASIAQTLFVLAWSATRWWVSATGRAFYFKSVTLMVWLDTSVVSYYADWAYETETKIWIYRMLTAGIVLQLAAFVWKRHQIRQEITLSTYEGPDRRRTDVP